MVFDAKPEVAHQAAVGVALVGIAEAVETERKHARLVGARLHTSALVRSGSTGLTGRSDDVSRPGGRGRQNVTGGVEPLTERGVSRLGVVQIAVIERVRKSDRGALRPNVKSLAGVYCERSMMTAAGPLSSGTCRDLCRITHPRWGNTHWDHYSTGYTTGQAAFAVFCVTWVGPFAVNSR